MPRPDLSLIPTVPHVAVDRLESGESSRANRFLGILLAAVVLASLPLREASSVASDLPGWQLVWEDDFAGTEVDTDKWELLTVRNSYNHEKQFYLPEQISVVDGKLRITASDEPMEDKLYRSGRLWTKQQWRFGRFEARIKLPTTQGMWPAFWLRPRHVPWPLGGEIDIMESRGSNRHVVSSAFHWGTSVRDHEFLSHLYKVNDANGNPVDFHEGFHVYVAEWEPTHIRFFVDGEPHLTVTNKHAPIHSTPKAIVFNVAVGGDFDGDPDESTIFPQTMEVDYVRVWQRERKAE